MVWLPLAWVRRRLVVGLESDWEVGVANANQVLDYTLQTISVFRATQEAYAQSSENVVLERSSILARSTHDWDLLYYCSARFDHELRRRAIDGIFWLPSRWKEAWQARYPINLRFDTPARAACAGFWLWHELDAPGAAAAFSHVRHIQHGPELSGIAAALAAAEAATDLESLVAWPEALTWLDNLPDPELRPETLKALRSLRSVALDASTVFHAHSPQNRALAVARAGGELKRLLDREHHACPEPEWPIFEKIAIRWRDILLEAGGVVGEEPLREPIRNPYEGYSGVPVKPPSFVGRGDIFRRIETLWSTTADLPVLILYGHRRMGKTSILRNLERSAPQGTLLVYLDMQDAAFVDHTGQFLLEIAEAVHQRAAAAGLDVGAPPAEVHFDTLGHARRALSKLLDTLDPELRTGRLVLAIDEFEFIEDGIQAGSIDPRVLGYLRSLNQKHPWLALVFGGLHTLDEMGRDYQAAFLAQTENVRVGYLKREDAVRLLTQPSEDFTLDYAPALLNDLWHLTSGQPFLLQRLAGELVMQWNERFLKTGEKTPRMLLPEDLEPVLTDDFYSGASYYFDGVWSNITAPERELLAVLAEREAPWTAEELAEAVGKPVDELAPVLELLRRHDALADPREQGGEASELRFASELLRRWVRRQG